jgi:diguanylate cyclase (GGDEF)-like protein
MIDVDHFKNFNDTYGHQAGDRVLHAVAQLFDEHVRKVDYVARYGGEEFAVIVPSTPREGLLYLAERLRSGVEAVRVRWESKELRVTISVGAAQVQEVTSPQEAAVALIRAADEQMYAAKCAGRNRVSSQTPAAAKNAVKEIAAKEIQKTKVPALASAPKK